ncbi:hypothetical protein DKX38_004334 [Salix brachista]|uniref:Disease resistance protein winged helix domain-containing protein n=1 Tax=Salix brachista TaxID=2182728 RepID=A0A5N5N9Q0_9ROSI|nr:hypothetical protein DKX38_004334 [Salix brachista]
MLCLFDVFPKYTGFGRVVFTKIWMANGFVSRDGRLEAGDVGNKKINELHWRLLLQDEEKGGFGKIIRSKMHDLFHNPSSADRWLVEFADFETRRVLESPEDTESDKMHGIPSSSLHQALFPEEFKICYNESDKRKNRFGQGILLLFACGVEFVVSLLQPLHKNIIAVLSELQSTTCFSP